jgi:hypothetical protein
MMARTAVCDSEGFAEKMTLNQGLVLTPLQFKLVMDVVTRGKRTTVELLHEDGIVLIAKRERELKERIQNGRPQWKPIAKGFKVNVEKKQSNGVQLVCGSRER